LTENFVAHFGVYLRFCGRGTAKGVFLVVEVIREQEPHDAKEVITPRHVSSYLIVDEFLGTNLFDQVISETGYLV
jgi:hypothetical protein